MPVHTSHAPGTPSFTDLATTDVAGAKAFYGAVFGWTFVDNPTDIGTVYTMARQGDHDAAGIMEQPAEQVQMGIPPMWNTYVTVADVAESVGKVEGLGGSVHMPPMDVMDAGVMAVVADPTGAVLCLWQAKEGIGSEIVNEHGALTWNEVTTPDVAAAVAFYSGLFGWGTDTMDMGDQGPYTVFMLGEDGVAGAQPPQMEGIPPHWGTVFAVDDCDAAAAAAAANGGTVVAGPFDMPPIGRGAVIADPAGAMFQIIQPAEPDGA